MTWLELLKKTDEIRSKIRMEEGFQKSPRSVVPKKIAAWFKDVVVAVELEESQKVVTLELDAGGRPIIPKDMQDLFATAPEEQPTVVGAKVVRRNPPQAPAITKESAETKATVLPRTTPHVLREPDLEEATESTVAR